VDSLIGKITRRELLHLTGTLIAGNFLVGCETEPANQPVIINSGDPIETIQGRILPPGAAAIEKQILYEPAAEPRHLDISRDIYGAGVAINWGGEPLLRRDQNQNLVPAMAEKWEAGTGAEYWDFTIRENARWSDGVPITADDWVFTFQHLASPELDNPWTWFYYDIAGVQDFKEGKGGAEDIGVEAIDERTVRIWGEGGAIPHLPALMAYQAVVPAPRHKSASLGGHGGRFCFVWSDAAPELGA
jgi:ABC-type transport system substrate-binding protein